MFCFKQTLKIGSYSKRLLLMKKNLLKLKSLEKCFLKIIVTKSVMSEHVRFLPSFIYKIKILTPCILVVTSFLIILWPESPCIGCYCKLEFMARTVLRRPESIPRGRKGILHPPILEGVRG